MTPKAITSALTAAQALFLTINRQPTDNDLVHLSDAISPILLKSTYGRVTGIHNLWGLVANADRYLHHYGAPSVRPATRLVCYNPEINTEASCVDRICAKTAWAAKIQDYKAYEAAERGIKVFIKAVVQDTWICDLHNPGTFYSNVTALALFNHLCNHSGGLHKLDMVLLTIQMSQYYKGMPDIPECISLLEDVQRKAARAHLPITNQNLTVLASTALLAANTFPCTTELWEELNPTDKTWATWKTAYLKPTRRGPTTSVPQGGLTAWAKPTQLMPTPSPLASLTPSTMPWTTLPALHQQEGHPQAANCLQLLSYHF
jgi:hypothetical protein